MKNPAKTAPIGSNLRDRHPEMFGGPGAMYRLAIAKKGRRCQPTENGNRPRFYLDRVAPSLRQQDRLVIRHGGSK